MIAFAVATFQVECQPLYTAFCLIQDWQNTQLRHQSHMQVHSLYTGPKCIILYIHIWNPAPAVRLGRLAPLANKLTISNASRISFSDHLHPPACTWANHVSCILKSVMMHQSLFRISVMMQQENKEVEYQRRLESAREKPEERDSF